MEQALAQAPMQTRVKIVRALGELREAGAVDALLQALRDEDVEVRIAAAQALGAIGGERVVDALLQALGDEDVEVRHAAARALGAIGGERAVDALLRDEDVGVCHAAEEALAQSLRQVGDMLSLGRAKFWQPRLLGLNKRLSGLKKYGLLEAALQLQAAVEVYLSPWQDPLRPSPSEVWWQRAAKALAAAFVIATLALVGAVLSGTSDVLRDRARSLLEALPWLALVPVAVVLALLSAGFAALRERVQR
ncbi:MAG: HEAT repeat domain-containing protein [Thermoflexales bacterium]|nr:HEAT repeat domain-containing protein [Thermoflexales bacterium]